MVMSIVIRARHLDNLPRRQLKHRQVVSATAIVPGALAGIGNEYPLVFLRDVPDQQAVGKITLRVLCVASSQVLVFLENVFYAEGVR